MFPNRSNPDLLPAKFYIEHLHDVYRYSVSDKELRLYYSKDEYFKFRINNPKGDDVKLMVMNNNLPEHLMLKGDLPIWMAEKVESAEAANLEGADNDYFYYQFQWMGQQHYMIRSGYSITVYTVSGSEEIFDLMDLFGSSRDWKIIYRVAPPEECGTMH